jgi:type I restriction enzyme S subunit
MFGHKNLRTTFRIQAEKNMTGSAGQKRVPTTFLREFMVPIPPLELQQKFASIFADSEKLREKQKQNEIELENLFQALLQKYFS